MRPKLYALLDEAVHRGCLYGLRRFYKHRNDAPSEAGYDAMAHEVAMAIMAQICEWFSFDDDN